MILMHCIMYCTRLSIFAGTTECAVRNIPFFGK